MVILTSEQIRKEEERGFAAGISYEKMMRTAGAAVADAVLEADPLARAITVVCGKGKNGGDGFVAACRLAAKGKKVSLVLALGAPQDELSRKMYAETKKYGIPAYDYIKQPNACQKLLQKADWLIDAVFGIGFTGTLREDMCTLAQMYNASPARKAALDIPSGLSADDSFVPEVYFHADMTVTMHAVKPVHAFEPSRIACGKVQVADIGFAVRADLYAACREPSLQWIAKHFTPRAAESHKGTYGYALSVCGSFTMPGAASLAARAAAECGAGLTAAAFPDRAYPALGPKLTEQIFVPCPSDENGFFAAETAETLASHIEKASAILFGCGAGTADGCAVLLKKLLQEAACPVILDADGINLVARHIDVLKEHKAPVLLTPHPGEMARLTGEAVPTSVGERLAFARDFAAKQDVVLLLKGHHTVVAAPDGRAVVNTTGNAGMATGGSGDLLSGIILSFAAQGMPLFDSAVCGAYIHGMAGDLAANKYSMMGTTPLRMLETLPAVLLQIEKAM